MHERFLGHLPPLVADVTRAPAATREMAYISISNFVFLQIKFANPQPIGKYRDEIIAAIVFPVFSNKPIIFIKSFIGRFNSYDNRKNA